MQSFNTWQYGQASFKEAYEGSNQSGARDYGARLIKSCLESIFDPRVDLKEAD